MLMLLSAVAVPKGKPSGVLRVKEPPLQHAYAPPEAVVKVPAQQLVPSLELATPGGEVGQV